MKSSEHTSRKFSRQIFKEIEINELFIIKIHLNMKY